jgi:triacylglycerol esterase/lipase EstA (alpha/beta hydrolase family)
MKKLTLWVSMIAAVMAIAGPATAQAQTNPVLFVHGLSSGSGVWNNMINNLSASGYTRLYNWSYNWGQSNATTASQIASKVSSIRSATGAARVDIVSHSMGALGARYYIKNLGGQSYVNDYVSIAGPNHGTGWANGCLIYVSCQQMVPGSSYLNSLNSGDETPGTSISYATIHSTCDLIVPSGVALSGAASNASVGCQDHNGMLSNGTTYSAVKSRIGD